MFTPGDSNHVQEYTASSAATNSPQELLHPSFFIAKEIDLDVHAENPSDDNKCTHYECSRCQHDTHLKEMVLFVVQHNVDVILCVVNILPQLPMAPKRKKGCLSQ